MTNILHRPASMPKNKMCEEMKVIKEELRSLLKVSLALDERDKRGFHEAPGAILGRDENTEEIIAQLFAHDTDEGPTILLITGYRGIGKTSVADLVFNHPRFKCYSRLWLNIPQQGSLATIGKAIFPHVSGKELEGSNNDSNKLKYITDRLHEVPKVQRVLIVLDDLWCDFGLWLSLKTMLTEGYRGSQSQVWVIATVDQALDPKSPATEIFGVQPYPLPSLNEDICGKIIKQAGCHTGDRSGKVELEGIVPEIAKLCKGFPLAAHLFGCLLQSKDYREWPVLLAKKLWPRYDPVYLSLELSFRSMPPDLRLCFAYCAMSRVGHPILKDDLIHQWIALNLIEPSEAIPTTELAEKYIMKLLDMSFLQTMNLGVSYHILLFFLLFPCYQLYLF